MNWEVFSALISNGDFVKLHTNISTKKIQSSIQQFDSEWVQYNPNKPNIPRYSLAVTSLDGKFNESKGSLRKSEYSELDFRNPTPLYNSSQELKRILTPWKNFLGRTQFIKIPPGGYFPPHVDEGWGKCPEAFRLVIPIKNVNPPSFYWMYGDSKDHNVLNWIEGEMYFLNTLKTHSLFNPGCQDSIWLVMNIELCMDAVIEMKRQVYT